MTSMLNPRGLLFLLLLSGCAGEGSRAGPPRVGDPLPEFSTLQLDGDTVALADYQGSPVLVNLWATWCPPCRAEMPYLESVSQEYGARGLKVVGISTDHSGALDQVRAVLEERSVTYDILLDTRSRSTELFAAFGLPVTFIADAEGIITYLALGPLVEGDVRFIAALDEVTGGAAAEGTSGGRP